MLAVRAAWPTRRPVPPASASCRSPCFGALPWPALPPLALPPFALPRLALPRLALAGQAGGAASSGELGGRRAGRAPASRQPVARDERGRDHVAGQPVGQVARRLAADGWCGAVPAAARGAWRVVRHQAGVARAAGRCHHRHLIDVRVPGEHALDLAGLDAEAAHLELAVHAPGDLEAAVLQPAAEVSGAVHPAAGGASGVGQEPLRGERGPPEVAPGDPAAANVDLPRRPGGNGVQLPVQDHDPRVADRPAHRHGGHRGFAAGSQAPMSNRAEVMVVSVSP